MNTDTSQPYPESQHDSARDRITQATLELVAQSGLGGVSMSAIATAAGVARQTVYNHFPDVDSIVGSALERHSIESLRSLESVLAAIDSPVEKLDHLVRHSAVVAEHAPGARGLYQNLSEQSRSAIEPHRIQVREIIESVLREGIDKGLFRPDLHIRRDSVLINHLLDGIAALIVAEPDQVPSIVSTTVHTVRIVVTR